MKTTEQVNENPEAATNTEMMLAALENNVKSLRWSLLKGRVDIAKEALDALVDTAQAFKSALEEATQ